MTQSQTFHYDILIREQHLDSFGHVNNATYLTLFEEARWDLITQRGFGLKEIQTLGMGPTILEVSLKFLKEIRLRQNIRIVTWARDYEGRVFTLHQQMLNDAGEVCCDSVFKLGLFDTKLRKLILPTPEWLHAVGL